MRSAFRLLILTGSLVACTSATVVSQHPRRFLLGIDVVPVYVTVTDGRDYLTDLREDEFTVLENGRKQQVAFFQQTGPPLSLTLLLDMSSSMRPVLPAVKKAAIGFVRELGPDDVASVVEFGDIVQVSQAFTSDHAALIAAIEGANASGSTPLYDTIYIALKEAARAEPGTGQPRRRTIVVLSDGADSKSLVGFQEVLALAARTNVVVYTISMGGPVRIAGDRASTAEFVMRRLALETGGRAFFPDGPRDLKGVYADIRDELASQYALAYEPSDPARDGLFRRIQVRVARAGAVARTRAGYFAPTR